MFEQDRVIGRLQRVVTAVPEIRVCFLSGSYGRHAADDYSDLDVLLLFETDERRETAWAARRSTAASIMPYVALKAYDGTDKQPYLFRVLLANGTLVELRYETKESLRPNPLYAHIRILKDDQSWAEEFERRSAGLAPPGPTISSDELRSIDNRFWVMFWEVLRLVVRGDLDRPFPAYLEMMQQTVPPLLRILPAGDPARAMLIQAGYTRDVQQTAGSMSTLLDAYLAARSAVIRYQHLQFETNEPFEREILRLVGRLT